MKPSVAQLPSWREGPTKDAIMSFLHAAHDVPVEYRAAMFDHDGTLRSERPTFLLFDFLVHEVRAAVANQPGAADRLDFQLMLRGDPQEIARFGLRRCITAAYELSAGMTPQEFTDKVRGFVRRKENADKYRQQVYQPMTELIEALRAAEFTVFINARFSVELVRSVSRDYYGIPPHCVIGAVLDYEYVYRDDGPVLLRGPLIVTEVGRGASNVVNIQTQTGRRPILAAANAVSDRELLEYTASADWPSLALVIHHDDADRESAYEEQVETPTGSEPFAEMARREGWTVVSMLRDWSTVFPPA